MYESPNPLKLHITLCCGRYSVSTLWEKLSNVLMETKHATKAHFDFKLSDDQSLVKQKNAIDLSISPTNKELKPCSSTGNGIYKPFMESHNQHSAFKPFKKEYNNENGSYVNLPQCITPNGATLQIWPVTSLRHDLFMLNPNPNLEQRFGDEAQIETLVSSMGKSKQGHICLYCGKCYSRKYGLKIHIRTHTGYKPLKCKYCLRPFGDPSNLNKHVRLHAEGDTPYK